MHLALASISWRSTALQSPTMPMSTLRGAVAISSASISMRAILALPLKRGGAAWSRSVSRKAVGYRPVP